MASQLPPAQSDWALFLDFDGTLVEIVERPDAVRLAPATRAALAALRDRLGGALAVISGRGIDDLDRFIALPGLAAAGLHGLERREADGTIVPPEDSDAIHVLRPRLTWGLTALEGVRLEDKGASLAVHWREAPQHGVAAEALLRAAAEGIEGLDLVPGKMVLEAKPAGSDKGGAIARFMRAPPFAGRRPVFAGDDVTDEKGFAAVEALGGIAIKVGDGPTRARYRAADVAMFTAWLVRAAEALTGGLSPAITEEDKTRRAANARHHGE